MMGCGDPVHHNEVCGRTWRGKGVSQIEERRERHCNPAAMVTVRITYFLSIYILDLSSETVIRDRPFCVWDLLLRKTLVGIRDAEV